MTEWNNKNIDLILNSFGDFVVNGSCQKNWVVLFTAGDNELTGNFTNSEMGLSGHIRTAPEAALELYKNSVGEEHPLRGVRLYVQNNNTYAPQEKYFVMDKGIRTLVVGLVDSDDVKVAGLREQLNAIAASGQPKLVNGEWVPDPDKKALFISNKPSTAEGMKNFIQDIREKVLERIFDDYLDSMQDYESFFESGTPPLIRTNDSGDAGTIYRPFFKRMRNDQWYANFNCNNFVVQNGKMKESTGSWSTEAGKQMAQKGLARKIYTSSGITGEATTEIIELTQANFHNLASQVNLADVDEATLELFRKWLFNPTNDGLGDSSSSFDITPLGDMERSNIVYVEREGEDDSLYIQTNRGMLHEINARTGEEIWAFIPPNVFQNYLKDLKFNDFVHLYDYKTDDGLRSLSLYLLDGNLATIPIKHNEEDKKQILVGTFGRGGAGLYAMDITNTEKPKFLWSVDNNNVSVAFSTLQRWGNAATNSGNFDYSKLGAAQNFSLCTLADKTIGILPANAVSYGVSWTGFGGNCIYVFDPELGSIHTVLKTLNKGTIADTVYLGNIFAPLTLIPSYLDKRKLGGFFVGDSQGNILYTEPTDDTGENWEDLMCVFRLRGVSDAGADSGETIAISKGILAIKEKSEPSSMYLVGGSNNILGLTQFKDYNATIGYIYRRYLSNKIINNQNYVFCLKVQPPIAPSSLMTSDLTKLDVDLIGNAALTEIPDINPYGWYVKLRTEDKDFKAEEMSVEPYLYRNIICLATFAATNDDVEVVACSSPGGVSRIYFFDPANGKAKANVLELPNVKVNAINGIGEEVLLSVQKLKGDALGNITDKRVTQLNDISIAVSLPKEYTVASANASANNGTPYTEFTRTIDFLNAAD